MKKIFILSAIMAASILSTTSAQACSRVLYVEPSQAVMVGRTMDWFEDLHTNLIVYPAGMARDGNAPENSLRWTSKYGSIVASAYDDISTDGMNEKGFAAHLLSLPESNYGERNPKIPAFSVILWAQYFLDNFASVNEAVNFAEKTPLQLIPFYEPHIKKYVNLHMAIEDASGDSAILEYTQGVLHIFHSRDYTILTNSPTYDQQLSNLKHYQGFGGDLPLPGTITPSDRFVRGAYYSAHLPTPMSNKEELAEVRSVIFNMSAPTSTPSTGLPYYNSSIWSVFLDLTHRIYYFNSTMGLNMIWTNLDKFNLQAGAPVMELDLVHEQSELHGDVSELFRVKE